VDLRFLRHGEIDSTSERAFAAIAGGTARHGDVHLAEAQTAGRGRFGRRWSSPRGEGLYASLVLLPPPPPWSGAALTIAAGLAVFDAAAALGVERARLDWPNDLVVGEPDAEAKLAGVLVETRGLAPSKPHYVVGIGWNVRQTRFPAELVAERRVASLATLGLDVSIEQTAEVALAALARRVESVPLAGEALCADFLAATGLAGRLVRARIGEVEHEGVLESIALADGVVLRGRDGSARSFPLEIVRRLERAL
jgi:BirA family transcriptional regulator, biotin operon repressor / biotin---[acetyl-CoA-carboxylase] ligase